MKKKSRTKKKLNSKEQRKVSLFDILRLGNFDVYETTVQIQFKYWMLISYVNQIYRNKPTFQACDLAPSWLSEVDLASTVKNIAREEVDRLCDKSTRDRQTGFIEGVNAMLNVQNMPFDDPVEMIAIVTSPQECIDKHPDPLVYEILESWC